MKRLQGILIGSITALSLAACSNMGMGDKSGDASMGSSASGSTGNATTHP